MSTSPATVRVLSAVRAQGAPISKAEIVSLTKLSLAAVTEHVDILCANGLLLAQDVGASSGGRKPKLYGFNPRAGCILAIDLESTHVNVALTDFGLRILYATSSDEIDVTRGPETTLLHIKDLVMEVLKAAAVKPELVKGLGMGVPGPVSFKQALPTSLSLMPGWDSYPVRNFWKAHFDCPSFVDNNVHTMALGERALAPASAPKDMIFVKIGNGIGAGIVCDSAIYRGATEHAGEIGHTHIGHDALCYCGNRGCLEAIAGGRAIARQAEEHARAGGSERLAAALANKGSLRLSDVIRAVQEFRSNRRCSRSRKRECGRPCTCWTGEFLQSVAHRRWRRCGAGRGCVVGCHPSGGLSICATVEHAHADHQTVHDRGSGRRLGSRSPRSRPCAGARPRFPSINSADPHIGRERGQSLAARRSASWLTSRQPNDRSSEARGLAKTYGGVTVLKGVGFTIQKGEVLALVGENGAGKSTLIKILSGAIPSEPNGQVLIEGRPFALHTPEDADNAGIVTVHQEFNLFPDLSITEISFSANFASSAG